MKRLLVMALVAALTLTMLAFLAGCGGGDENKEDAKNYMNAGDNYMDEVQTTWTLLDELQTEMGMMVMEGTALTPEDLAAMEADYEEQFTGLANALDSAKAEYEKINALEGVEDYKLYASKMIEAIDVYGKALEAAIAVAEAAGAQLAAGASLDQLMELMNSEEFLLVDELRGDGDDLYDEAEEIKLDNKLAD